MRLGRGFTRFRGRAGLLKGDRGAGNFVYKQNWGRRRVCVSALAEDAALLGRGRQGERAGYFLLSSSGSGRRKERVEQWAQEGELHLLVHLRHTHLEGLWPPSLLTCGVPDPSPPPTTTPRPRSPSSRGSQRDAAQPSPADWKARTQPHSCQCPQEGHGPHVEAGNSSSGSRESCERKCPQGCAWAAGVRVGRWASGGVQQRAQGV